MKKVLLALLLVACSGNIASPQQTAPTESHGSLKLPQVKYVLDYDKLSPQHQEMVIGADGNGLYSSSDLPGADGGEPAHYTREFSLTPATRDQIFKLAKQANYFHGEFDYKKNKIAFTGSKTLTYLDEKTSGSATYNWSENKVIQQLTDLFAGICNTLEAEPRLKHMRKFDKLALDQELKNLVVAARNGRLLEIQLIADTLREVSNDTSVVAPARRRAELLTAWPESGH